MLIKIGNTEKLPLTSLLSGLQSQFYLMHAQLPKYFKYSLCILKKRTDQIFFIMATKTESDLAF